MNTITLQNLKLESFKGLHHFEASFDGQDAVIRAENGAGKTTLYDAWLWLAFGKDSTGRTNFEVRPLDTQNRPLKGLVVMVEATITAGGQTYTLRKEQHEKVVKDQFKGYETLCWVDEVPKKVGEYQEFIDSLIPEESFKMLADISYFNVKLHHTERRKMLLALAGNVAKPQGWDNLLAVLKGRSVKDYEGVLKDQKARHTKERDEINPRLDEINRVLNGYAAVDTAAIETMRGNLFSTIADLDEQRKTLLAGEKARQNLIDQINHLTVQRLDRQSRLRSNGNQTQSLLNEKAQIAQTLAAKEEAVNAMYRQIKSIESSIESAKHNLTGDQFAIERIRVEIDAVDKVNIAAVCFACGQKLPKAKIEENQAKRETQKQQLIVKAESIKTFVDSRSAEIEQLQKQHKALSDKAKEHYETFLVLCDSANVRNAEIDAVLKNRPEPDYSKDAEYCRLTGEIAKLQAQVGESVAVQLEALESRKNIANEELSKVNAALSQADRARQDKERIAELEAKEKDLAQKIADIDRQLADCADYRAAESRLIEGAVNGLFTHVQFKLFNFNLNGSIEDTCESMLQGVPYADISYGQKILAGMDIINALSAHYGISVPIFIDNSEGLTYEIETDAQVIRLMAVEGIHELEVTLDETVDSGRILKRTS